MKISTYVGDAGPKGEGVYAAEQIGRGTRVATFYGRPKWIWDIPEEVWPYTIQVDYDRYVLPRRKGVVWYMNHSCDPSCVISGNGLVAERDIKKGEELTFDYATDVDWPGFRMTCSCGSLDCRKVVRAYRFLPAKQKQRYGRNVAPFILREYFQRRGARGAGPVGHAGPRAVPR